MEISQKGHLLVSIQCGAPNVSMVQQWFRVHLFLHSILIWLDIDLHNMHLAKQVFGACDKYFSEIPFSGHSTCDERWQADR